MLSPLRGPLSTAQPLPPTTAPAQTDIARVGDLMQALKEFDNRACEQLRQLWTDAQRGEPALLHALAATLRALYENSRTISQNEHAALAARVPGGDGPYFFDAITRLQRKQGEEGRSGQKDGD